MPHLEKPVRLVERNARERGVNFDSRCARCYRVGFSSREEGRTKALPCRATAYVHRYAMLWPLHAVVAGKAENGARPVDVADCDEEYFSGVHCSAIEITRDALLPVPYDLRGIECRTDRQNRVAMRQRDLIDVRRSRPTDLKRSYPSAVRCHFGGTRSASLHPRLGQL